MSKKSHKALASATVMSLILTSTLTATVSAATGVERLSGSNRETTAIDVATKVFEKAETVVLVNGYKSADALSATPLAKAYNAPILSVGAVDEPTAALTKALADLGAKKVIVVGGEGAVTKALATKLAETYTVERIEGKDRYATNVAVAEKVMELKDSKEAFVVNGSDASYADALSIASIAASKGAPIVFTNGKTVSEEAKALVKGLEVTAIGGTGVVSADVLAAVDATRVGGADRFATNLEVLKAYKDVIKLDNVFVAYGLNFADALVASAAAAKTDAPVVLADKTNTKFTEGATDFIEANKAAIKNVYLVGGTGVIADSVKNAINGIVNPVATNLVVESAIAANLKQIKVVFNKDVDKTTAEDIANYSVKNASSTELFDGAGAVARLQADNRTVILTVETASTLTSLKDHTVEVKSNVKAVTGETLGTAYVNTKVNAVDVTVPTVEKIEMVGPKTIKVVFSEPINATSVTSSDFKLDNGSIGLSSTITSNIAENSITITAGTNLSAGEHKLVINANSSATFVDFAGYPVIRAEKSFAVQEVKSAPSFVVESAKPNKVVLKFERPVKQVDLASIYHGYASNTASTITALNAEGGYADRWEVTFAAGKYIPVGNVTLTIKNSTTSGNEILDRWSNKVENQSVSLNISADTTKPTVNEVVVENRRTIKVRFSEDVLEADAENKSYYTFKKNDKVITASDFSNMTSYGHPNSSADIEYDSNNNVATITFNADFPTGDYTLTVKDIKDTATYTENKMAEVVVPFTISNTNSARLTSAILTGSKVYLTFDKAMATSGAGSVLDVANYQLEKTAGVISSLPSGSTVSLGSTNKEVIITLGSTTGIAATTSYISAVVNDEGNKAISVANARQQLQALTASEIGSSNIKNIKLVDKKTVTFEVTKPLNDINISKISIAADTNGANGIAIDTASYVNQTLSDGSYGALVTLKVSGADDSNTLATSLSGSGMLDNVDSSADQTNNIVILAGGLTNSLDQANTAKIEIANAAKDYAKAYIADVQTGDNDTDGQIDRIIVDFSEALYAPSVQDSDFKVDGYSINKIVTVSGTTVTLEVEEKGTFDSSATPDVTLVSEVQDNSENRNVTSSNDEVTAIDRVAPAIASLALAADDKVLTITFSEKIANNKVDLDALKGAITFAADGSAYGALAANDTVSIDANGRLVITFDSALTTATNTVKIAANSVKDLATTPVVQATELTTNAINATNN